MVAVIALASACSRTPDPVARRGVVESISRSHPVLAPLLRQARARPVRRVTRGYAIGSSTETPRGLPPEAEAALALRRRAQHADVTAELPPTAAGTVRLTVARGDFTVGVRHRGALGTKAQLDHGALVYRKAVRGTDIVWLAHGESVEELWQVRDALGAPAYELDLPPGATLHTASRSCVELRDAHGTAWMRLTARRAWDAAGRVLEPRLVVSGRTIALELEPGAKLPVVIDPQWESTAAMSQIREHGTATLLPSGRVLLAGGTAAIANYVTPGELYDPATGTFSLTGNILQPRIYHTATLLPTGKVLVVGGAGPNGGFHATAELYDEHTGLFTSTGSMSQARSDQTATLLPSGKVLVAGGKDQNLNPLGSAELYDPASGTFAAAGNLVVPRYGATATLLSSGKVLLVGGYSASGVTVTAELYDPTAGASGSSTLTGPMAEARGREVATLLPSGKVLVAGGIGTVGSLGSAELYDPLAGAFSPTGPMTAARNWPSAVLLTSGKVLVTGGKTSGVGLSSADLYDPQSHTFSAAPSMTVPRVHHNSVVLPSGKVLVAGGPYSTAVDVYDPANAPVGSVSAAGPMNDARRYATATLLPSGKVLVAGGETFSGPVKSADLYDPSTRTFTPTGSMTTPRSQHTATLLASGKVLIAGGDSLTSAGQLASAELYDPSTGTFTATGSMSDARAAHTATLLSTGEVLMVGGITTANGILAKAELYEPSSGTFKETAKPMAAQRFGHTATLLRSGKVLVTGGLTGNATAEVYDPDTESFSSVGNLTRARFQHTATLLASGKVLIVGGVDGATPLSSAELYDPATGGFTQTGSMVSARSGHTATMLPSGDVLVAGGAASGELSSIEVYDPLDGANGGFVSGGNLAQARADQVANLLPDGDVLIAGGFASGNQLASAETWNAGAVGNASWRATLSSVPPNVVGGQAAAIAGSGLTGISEAGSGCTQSSNTNYPLAVWMPTQGGWGTLGDITAWSATGATWTPPPTSLAGPGWLFTVTSGIPSVAQPTTVAQAQAGAACTVAGQCATGFCADGVCCDSSCDQPCQACSAALKGSGADGVCGPVAKDTDPKDQCATSPQATCGTTGDCDGAGACALYPQGTVCFAASCSGPVLTPAFTCDGSGNCQATTPIDCTPDLCTGSGTTAACGTSCVTGADCAPSSFCKQNTCVAPQTPGAKCQADAQCLSKFCVDGVCCNSACDQKCAACVQSKTGVQDGLCAPVMAGTDPNSDCAPATSNPCGYDGECSGAFSCEFHDKTTECGKPSCIDGTDQSTGYKHFCDGKGGCSTQPVPSSCGNYKCGTNKACRTSCAIDEECAPLYRCDTQNHVCVPRGKNICVGDVQETPDGVKTPCAPFACNQSSGLCRTTCSSGADCAAGFGCNSGGRCTSPFPAPQPTGCGCSVPGRRSSQGDAWLLLALGLVLVGARRCSPGPRSERRRRTARSLARRPLRRCSSRIPPVAAAARSGCIAGRRRRACRPSRAWARSPER